MAPGSSDTSPRVRLDRDRILDAAQAIVAAEGLSRLTMRRIGAELDADPTAVYRHFRSKDELLVELAGRLFGTVARVDPALPVRERLAAQIRHARERYRCHPDLAVLLAVQPDDRLALQTLLNGVLGLLAEAGLSPRDAAHAYQMIEHHVVGTGLFTAFLDDRFGTDAADASAARRAFALLPPERFPHAVAAAPHLFPDRDGTFDRMTALILDEIERLAAAAGG